MIREVTELPALPPIEAAFTGRGPWKRRIPPILDALGRARPRAGGERAVDAGVSAA